MEEVSGNVKKKEFLKLDAESKAAIHYLKYTVAIVHHALLIMSTTKDAAANFKTHVNEEIYSLIS